MSRLALRFCANFAIAPTYRPPRAFTRPPAQSLSVALRRAEETVGKSVDSTAHSEKIASLQAELATSYKVRSCPFLFLPSLRSQPLLLVEQGLAP